MHTLHLASPAPSAFWAWSVLVSPFSAWLFANPFHHQIFPFFFWVPSLSSLQGVFLGLGSGFRGAGLADNLAHLLCGSPFTLASSALLSPQPFSWAWVGNGGRGHAC
jgi:hypothetical protein